MSVAKPRPRVGRGDGFNVDTVMNPVWAAECLSHRQGGGVHHRRARTVIGGGLAGPTNRSLCSTQRTRRDSRLTTAMLRSMVEPATRSGTSRRVAHSRTASSRTGASDTLSPAALQMMFQAAHEARDLPVGGWPSLLSTPSGHAIASPRPVSTAPSDGQPGLGTDGLENSAFGLSVHGLVGRFISPGRVNAGKARRRCSICIRQSSE
jgi:hypothetical protein